MTRLIDADAFIEDMKDLYRRAGWGFREIHFSLCDTISNIDNMPTIGALPVRHGKWCEGTECYSDDFIVCSVCGEAFNVMDNDTYRFDYCPKCGARMDEE